jgi:hypothetical protein
LYVRPEGRRSISIPDNYGGNAFGSTEQIEIPEPTVTEEAEETSGECSEKKSSLPFGIGSEELLLLGIILILSQSDEGGDILPFLLMLLFFKGGK